jgi:transmembrane sensor
MAAESEAVRLAAGDRLDHKEGASMSQITRGNPEDAFAWRRGMLVYTNRPLDEVSSDLERYVATPIVVEPSAARLRFTGVLRIDDGHAMVQRLEAFLPVTVVRSANVIRLKARDPG